MWRARFLRVDPGASSATPTRSRHEPFLATRHGKSSIHTLLSGGFPERKLSRRHLLSPVWRKGRPLSPADGVAPTAPLIDMVNVCGAKLSLHVHPQPQIHPTLRFWCPLRVPLDCSALGSVWKSRNSGDLLQST